MHLRRHLEWKFKLIEDMGLYERSRIIDVCLRTPWRLFRVDDFHLIIWSKLIFQSQLKLKKTQSLNGELSVLIILCLGFTGPAPVAVPKKMRKNVRIVKNGVMLLNYLNGCQRFILNRNNRAIQTIFFSSIVCMLIGSVCNVDLLIVVHRDDLVDWWQEYT